MCPRALPYAEEKLQSRERVCGEATHHHTKPFIFLWPHHGCQPAGTLAFDRIEPRAFLRGGRWEFNLLELTREVCLLMMSFQQMNYWEVAIEKNFFPACKD